MASIEFIQKRIAGKEAEIAKLEKKLERILKAKESDYKENNPYYYSDYDLRVTTKELDSAKVALDKYKAELEIQTEKDNSRDVKVILEFLDKWKDSVYDLYVNGKSGLKEYYADQQKLREMYRKLDELKYYSPEWQEYKEEVEEFRSEFSTACRGVFEEIPKEDPRWTRWNHTRKVSTGKYEWLKVYTDRCSTLDEACEYLKKTLEEEAKRKYDDIIERTNRFVGQITDASGLTIGNKGDLNGVVIGTNGKAKVETVGAGGYNEDVIVNVKHGQVFHFRTLINPIK